MQPAPRKVVVGDRDAIVLALITHILTREGFAVDPINNREELLSIIHDGDCDVIVADAHLDGVIEAVHRVPSHRSTRVILTSPRELEAPVYATLRKPLELGLLVDTVRDCAARAD